MIILTVPVSWESSRQGNKVKGEVSLQNLSEQWSPEYISVGFIAKRCGVSNTTVLRWITTGQLPAFRLPGGHYRIEKGDFSEFLTKNSMLVRNTHKK
jgi:excisionase family DNA binding protein